MTDYKKWRSVSLLVFVPAFLIFIVTALIIYFVFLNIKFGASPDSAPENNSSVFLVTGVSLVTSFLTSAISLLGLVFSSLLSWKKEKRDRETFDIDNERKKLENEKMKYEIEQLKNTQSKKKAKR